jgi:hypothetical protein
MVLLSPTLFKVFQPFMASPGTKDTGGNAAAHNISLWIPKLVFLGMNLALFGMGVYKCSTLGLLPTSESDWMAFHPAREVS